jgi:hypothetical protein
VRSVIGAEKVTIDRDDVPHPRSEPTETCDEWESSFSFSKRTRLTGSISAKVEGLSLARLEGIIRPRHNATGDERATRAFWRDFSDLPGLPPGIPALGHRRHFNRESPLRLARES